MLPYAECADAMRAALSAYSRGQVHQPLRTVIRPEGASGLMGLMPAYQPPPGGAAADQTWPGDIGFGVKTVCVFPGNPAAGLDAHQGVVMLFSARTGEPRAVVNASAVTEIRTAAVSAVATGLLARPGAADLGIIGTGVQARAHLLAIAAARPLASVRVAGRDQGRSASFAEGMRGRTPVPVTACGSAQEAVDGAGIVVTVTSSAQPVLRREWLAPGTHINAVGSSVPQARELDTETMAGAALFADSRESVTTESGDYLLAQADGAIGPGHIRAELGEVINGTAPGRLLDDEITVFESLGLAAEDLAAATLACSRASGLGAGTRLEF